MTGAMHDPGDTFGRLARVLSEPHAAVAVDAFGRVSSLSGIPGHPLLGAESPVVKLAVSQLVSDQPHTAFLWPWRSAPTHAGPVQDNYVRITGLACDASPPTRPAGLILLQPIRDTHGLTPRELQILGLLVDGGANQHIASVLFITARTVAAHLEHIRSKIRAPTRTAAALYAVRHGLYLPAQLVDRRGRTSRPWAGPPIERAWSC
ncbi:response regulator transcription factor [Cryptosporangium arvum]|uniref:Response regulator containing a CheY-like receiver domain and an HTH DNA-binding domain n=1 Tax=Cryptosporangium arvum DSM 44712 TaxID=927661 RepID=A0A010ZY94_9ACTN|nr:LuxR C-terminal-related transcriptional regulator [Cryptosporangium arvum]EXG82182.1 response regulator containing a CheY-like receiver domain and an HTH DNA-binding domain [Cryptosporangium arvum DSM 44712]